MAQRHLPTPAGERGVLIVEMLVGVAVGTLVVAAALAAWAIQARTSSALVAQSRLTHELRTATALVANDLRRVGYWGASEVSVAVSGGSPPTGTVSAATPTNPYSAISSIAAPTPGITFGYSRDAVENHVLDAQERFGFRLRDGVLEMRLGTAPWQAMTDRNTLAIEAFTLTPVETRIDLGGSCTRACPAASSTCPPRQIVRSLQVRLAARGVAQATTVRSASTQVRLRNDVVIGQCAV
jgi:type IV pilus assembly protein PilW